MWRTPAWLTARDTGKGQKKLTKRDGKDLIAGASVG
jgi:hypothetical protein